MIEKEAIKKAVEAIDNKDKDELESYIEKITEDYDNLTTFTLSTAVEFDNDVVSQFALYYYAILFEVFNNQYENISALSEDQINDFLESQFYPALDDLYKKEDEDQFYATLHEKNVIDFLTVDLRELQKEDESFDDMAFSQLFILTSALTGLLQAAAEE